MDQGTPERALMSGKSSRMAAMAANELVRLGYTNVSDLESGMIAWQQAGFALSRKLPEYMKGFLIIPKAALLAQRSRV